MIDSFSILLTHGLMLIAAWRLLARADLDDDSAPPTPMRRMRIGRRGKADAPDA